MTFELRHSLYLLNRCTIRRLICRPVKYVCRVQFKHYLKLNEIDIGQFILYIKQIDLSENSIAIWMLTTQSFTLFD